jgi:hypothetical protein
MTRAYGSALNKNVTELEFAKAQCGLGNRLSALAGIDRFDDSLAQCGADSPLELRDELLVQIRRPRFVWIQGRALVSAARGFLRHVERSLKGFAFNMPASGRAIKVGMPLLNHIETDSKKPQPLCRAVQQHFAPVGRRAAARMRGSIALGAR